MTTTSNNSLPLVKQAHIIQRLYTTPLVSEFGSSIPIDKPSGKIFFLGRSPEKKYDGSNPQDTGVQHGWGSSPEGSKVSTYKFDIMSKTIEMKTQKIKSAWTLEAIQDYKNMFVEKPEDEISKTLAGEITNEAIFQLDYEFIDFAKKESKVYFEDFTPLANLSKFDLCFNLVEKIYKLSSDMVARLHNKSCINVLLSSNLCSVLMSHPHFKAHEKIDGTIDEANLYYVGRIHNIKIFNDYYNFLERVQGANTSSSMLIGVKDLHNNVNCSVIYSPYQSTVASEVEPDTGHYGIFVFHSYGLTMCPQHSVESPMLKFVEFTNSKQLELSVKPKTVKLEFGDVSSALNIENFGSDFDFSITNESIASFDKGSKTITAKGVVGTTDLIIKANNQEERVRIEVTAPKISIGG